jgi:hypothetical protein
VASGDTLWFSGAHAAYRPLLAYAARMVDASEHLDERERQLWLEYEKEEDAGLRQGALRTLAAFIDAVRSYPESRREAWVEAFCRDYWDDYDALTEGWNRRRVRHPLVADLILPTLVDGYRTHRPNYARWLGEFALSGVFRGAGLMPPDAVAPGVYNEVRYLGMGEFEPADLLREALAQDASDTRAAQTLIGYLEEKFDYWTHHVPDYVLTDDTQTWRAELDEFEELVRRYPASRGFDFELKFWRFHCDAWTEYREREHEFENYSEFLAQRDDA